MTIAAVVCARGKRGEVAAEPLSSRMERYALLKQVFLFGPGGPLEERRPFEIQSVWLHRGRVIFKFEGVDSISGAERLRGAEVRIPLAARFEAAPGEYFHSDLIGCEVIDSESGETLGRVRGYSELGGPGLLEVQRDGAAGELLIPFARSICVEIDVKARRIRVNLPDGLKELNGP